MENSAVVTINEANFESEVTRSAQPVLVDFWAEWCGPCKMIAPLLDEIAREKAGAVKVAKVNVDHNQSLSVRYNIRAIPTLLFFKGGEMRDQITGMASKKDLLSRLEASPNELASRFVTRARSFLGKEPHICRATSLVLDWSHNACEIPLRASPDQDDKKEQFHSCRARVCCSVTSRCARQSNRALFSSRIGVAWPDVERVCHGRPGHEIFHRARAI